MTPAKSKLFAAKIHILHMSSLSKNLVSLVYFGIHHATTDLDYYDKVAKDIGQSMSAQACREVGDIMRELASDQGAVGVKAASTVFMHAGLEAALLDVINAFFYEHPEQFYQFVSERKISLGDLRNKDKMRC